MNIQDASDSGPIAARTRSGRTVRNTGETDIDNFCDRRCALGGPRPLSPSSSSSLNPSLSLETEFPYFSPVEDHGMAHDQPPLVHERLYEILGLMTEQLERVQEQVIGNANNTGGVQPPIFSGSPSEDVNDWLETFNRYARFRRWNNDQQLDAFMMFLSGNAKRSASNNLKKCALI